MKAEPVLTYEYHVGGTLLADDPTYVKRQADDDFYKALKVGNFCYVFSSRQMGKSSLKVRTMKRLQAEGCACVAIDLTGIGSSNTTSTQWYASIIRNIAGSLSLNFDLQIGRAHV